MPLPSNWSDRGGKLRSTYRFPDFARAFAFLTEVALVAQRRNHHPDFSVHWGTVKFTLWSHDEGRITKRDRKMAKEIANIAKRDGVATQRRPRSGARERRTDVGLRSRRARKRKVGPKTD